MGTSSSVSANKSLLKELLPRLGLCINKGLGRNPSDLREKNKTKNTHYDKNRGRKRQPKKKKMKTNDNTFFF